MTTQKSRALQDIAEALKTAPCPLRKTATQPVAGEGNPDAEFFFIGEAPGKNEDLQGRPFIGAAGKVLSELLESIGLQREDVFITSIEKFRPPKNRDPKPEEILACFPYLEQQIETIQPKVIVCLGRHSLRRMLEWENGAPLKRALVMADWHGKPFTGKNGRLYYTVHHPAAALYGFSRETLREDFKKIPTLTKQKKVPPYQDLLAVV